MCQKSKVWSIASVKYMIEIGQVPLPLTDRFYIDGGIEAVVARHAAIRPWIWARAMTVRSAGYTYSSRRSVRSSLVASCRIATIHVYVLTFSSRRGSSRTWKLCCVVFLAVSCGICSEDHPRSTMRDAAATSCDVTIILSAVDSVVRGEWTDLV